MRTWLPISLVATLLLAGLLYLRQPPQHSAAPAVQSPGPRELVAGVAGIQQPRATPEEEHIDLAVLNASADYAVRHGSTALLVSRHGHLVFERYWGGTTRDTLIDAGGFAATVAAMLIGVALDERHIVSLDEPLAQIIPGFNGAKTDTTLRRLLEADDAQPLIELTEALSGKRYAQFLSHELWKPVAAGDAWVVLDKPQGRAVAACCFYARQGDWLRLAQLLLNDGGYQGSQLLPRGWVQQLLAPSANDAARGSHLHLGIPRGGFYVAGRDKNRLWLDPRLHLAVLRLGGETSQWEEARLPELVISAVLDRPAPQAAAEQDLSSLVPHH